MNSELPTSPDAARQAGLKFYEGRECLRGHGTTKYTNNKTCVECSNGHARNWRATNPERKTEVANSYYHRNVDQFRSWRKNWLVENSHKKTAQEARRRALKLSATPSWVDHSAINAIYAQTPTGYQVDHIVPLNHPRVCGLHVHWNLRPIPKKENGSKTNKLIAELAVDRTAPGWS